ncbi:hypothetical protein D4R42_02640 [bacterium]|nr:MAG: hypothetical protein D4R42_02640 [bacterium]
MTLAALKTKLIIKTGTSIADVIFDYDLYFNNQREKTYPFVLWAIDGASFKKDHRSTTIQKTKILTLTAFVVINYDPNTQNKITLWDTIEGYFDTYINKMNDTDCIRVLNIDDLKGVYLHEGERSADTELGVMYPEIQIKMWC